MARARWKWRQLRSDPGAGPRAGRASRHLSAELDEPVPHRRPEEHHVRIVGPARLARRTGSCSRAAIWAIFRRSAKALREARELGLIDRLPRLAVIQAEGCRALLRSVASAAANSTRWPIRNAGHRDPHRRSGLLAQGAARNPRHKRVVEKVTRAGNRRRESDHRTRWIGCEPASAATLAGIRKLTAAGVIARRGYGRGADWQRTQGPGLHLQVPHRKTTPGGIKIRSTFGNQPVVGPKMPTRSQDCWSSFAATSGLQKTRKHRFLWSRLRIGATCTQSLTEPRPKGAEPAQAFFRNLLRSAAVSEQVFD